MWSRSSRVILASVAALGLCAWLLASCGRAPVAHHAPASPTPSPPSHQLRGGLMIGVYEPYAPGSYWQIPKFAQETGHWPQIVSYYSKWWQPFASEFAAQAAAHGAETLVQITPRHVSLAAIAAGQQDAYLKRYAAAVRQFGHPVIISFGQEMNGSWYPWGWSHVSPAVFIAAWRHIVRLFRHEGTHNVTWLWDVNHQYPRGMAPLRSEWPGAAYVTWIGLDSYLAVPGSTYGSYIAPDIVQLRAFGKPILLAETAAGPYTGNVPGKIRELLAGARRDHLKGVVWFDVHQRGSVIHQDWRLEDDPAGLAAFRKGVSP